MKLLSQQSPGLILRSLGSGSSPPDVVFDLTKVVNCFTHISKILFSNQCIIDTKISLRSPPG